MHFVTFVRGHCTILMETTRLNEDIDRGVLNLTRVYENAVSQSKFYLKGKEHLTWKIDGFNELTTLFERLDSLGSDSFN